MKIVVTPRGFAKCGLDNVKIIKDENSKKLLMHSKAD